MKNLFLFFAGFFLLALSACQNDEFGENGKGTVSVSFTAQLPEGGATTRAEATAGNGSQINRCILEVYLGDEVYVRKVVAVTNKIAKFTDVRLLTSQRYDFVFWADRVAANGSEEALATDLHYDTTTEGLTNITFKDEYSGSTEDDTRDAFFCKTTQDVTNALTLEVDLTRPFGQLKLITDDYDKINNGHAPTTAKLTFKSVHTGFNALLGEPTAATTSELNYLFTDIVDLSSSAGAGKALLTLDYIFAPSSGQLPMDMTLTAPISGQNDVTRDLTSIPIQRNYVTNVTGSLLTSTATVTATLQPVFTGTEEHPYVEAKTTTEVVEALNNGAVNVKLTVAPEGAATIALPEAVKDKAISISLPATTAKVTVSAPESADNAPAALTIDALSASDVDIQTPNSTVTLNGADYEKVTASTAGNTLIIGKGVTVADLQIAKGNVEVYGKVTKLARTGENKDVTTTVTYYTAEQGTIESGQELNFVIYEVTDLTADLAQKSEANLIVKGNNASLSAGKTINAKSIILSDISIVGRGLLTINATEGITLKDIVLNPTGRGDNGTANGANCNLLINPNGSDVVLDNISAPAGSSVYNGIEFGQDNEKAKAGNVTIKNCNFDFTKWTHNCINIYSFKDNAVVNIDDCKFILDGKSVPEAIRLSNYTNATGVTINVTDCNYKYVNTETTTDANKVWYGFFLFQNVKYGQDKTFSSWNINCKNLKCNGTLVTENTIGSNNAATQLSCMSYDASGIIKDASHFPTFKFNDEIGE